MKTLIHLSDLHFGRTDARAVAALESLVASAAPDVVVVSGDLTQRAKPEEFRQARRFLDALPRPQIVVPGNHDVPLYNVFQRFAQPLLKYRRFIDQEPEPFYVDAEIAVAGINTARSLTFKDGRINKQQMQLLCERFAPLNPSVMKIVVTHHPFDLPNGHSDGNVVGRARAAMHVFRKSGADLLLAGHLHVSHVGSSEERYALAGYSALVIQAGTATSTRGRGETNSFNVIRIDSPTVGVERWAWKSEDGVFQRARTDLFIRGKSWQRIQAVP
jgi:3',5'-cyclic AMP phosphodiesterase CpdA